MNRITQLAVVRRSVVIMLAAALFLTGTWSWTSLQQELLPDVAFPVITVVSAYPGAGASDVTAQVTKPIERAVAGVPRLEQIQSTSANSFSVVVTRFSFGTDVKETRAAIEANLRSVTLPNGVTPQVSALDINASPVIIASISGTGTSDLAEVGRIARTEIVPAIQALDGVGSVDLNGGLEERIMVTLDPGKLAAAGVSLGQVNGVLAANNLTLPSGTVSTEGEKIPVSTTASFASLDAIRELVVGMKLPAAMGPGGSPGGGASGSTGGSTDGSSGATTGAGSSGTEGSAGTLAPVAAAPTPIALEDLGTVELIAVPTTGYARTDGEPALTLVVSKQTGANTVTVADEVTAALADAAAANPGVKVRVVNDLSSFIKESRDGLVREGGLGALFAILTIFLFLFSLRSTLVAAVSIPLSIMAALTLMLVTNVSLNIMTLGGLAVAVGRVVDDAIVVLENIYRHRARGEDRMTAVRDGAREVSGAITASTLTTVMVFLPLGFVGGLVSQFFLPFALTVTFALLASLLCAITVVPVLAYFLVDRVKVDVDPETGEPAHSIWVNLYTPTIRFILRRRASKWGVIALAAILFLGSFALLPGIPTQFINAGGEKNLLVTISPPSGASSVAVLDRTKAAESRIRTLPEVTVIQATVPGEGDTGVQSLSAAFSGRAANSATLRVGLTKETDLKAETRRFTELLGTLREDGWDVAVSEATGFSAGGIDVIVSSADPAAVATANRAILERLQGNPDLVNVKSDLAAAAPVVEITVDPNEAIGAGLTTAQVAQEVRGVLVPTRSTRVTIGEGDPLDLYLRIDPTTATSLEALRTLPVGTARKVPLGDIATVRSVERQGSVTRIDQQPAASITGEITSEDTGAVSRAVQAELDDLKATGAIPAGVTVRLAGVTEQQSEAFGGLFVSMAVAILLVYVMMVITFDSLITPFVILFTLPLATIGAFPALFLTNRPIGISALIGFLMLIGIVVTNAIVLLDLVERLRGRGASTTEALVEGGRTRVRPILMTAIATMLALIPLAAGFNEGSIIAAELGTVVIGGLFSSTFLTLLVVPVVYSLIDDAKGWRGGRRARLAAVAATAATAATEVGSATPTATPRRSRRAASPAVEPAVEPGAPKVRAPRRSAPRREPGA